MAATVSPWGKPGAWALDAEENEAELLHQRKEDSSPVNGGETADFPSLAAAATTKAKKKKKSQTLSLQEFSAGAAGAQPKGLTPDELLALPTGPRQRSAEELDRNKLGGGFRSYGGGGGARDEQARRQGSFNRDSSGEFGRPRADEIDDWGAGKKLGGNNGLDRKERGERGVFFGESKADEVDNWAANKSFVSSEPRRYEKRGSFGLESSNGGSDSSNWAKRKEEEGRKFGGALDSLRERRGGLESNGVDSESWGKKREESSGGNRPRLNLQPRTLPVNEGEKSESANVVKPKGSNPFGEARPREDVLKEKGQDWKEIEEKLESVKIKEEGEKSEITNVVKPKGSNPFGEARPREDVLKEKGQDWKEIEEKLESVKIKEVTSAGPSDGPAAAKRSFWGGNGQEDKIERSWRRPELVDPRLRSGGETAEHSEKGNAENAEDKDS